MVSAGGRFVLIYNGEIYNYRCLRRELEAWGYPFAGTSDTEVLLAGFVRWGLIELFGGRTGCSRSPYGIVRNAR